MQKLQDWIGLPILETESGGQLGEVKEVVVNLVELTVIGVILSNIDWIAGKSGVLYQDIVAVGHDALIVKKASVVQNITQLLTASGILTLENIFGKPVYTDRGDCLGTIEDVVFDPDIGKIAWYQLSGGLITDLIYGRLKMPLPDNFVIDEEKIIVPAAISKLLSTEIRVPGGV